MSKKRTPLKYRLNPCDFEHYEVLMPMQKFFELFSKGTDCKCCLGARVFFGFVIGAVIGFAVGLLS